MISSEARNQFLILSKSATGKACESFISQLLGHPQIFIFKEFLDLPNVQELKNASDKKYYNLLTLFTYGTYTEYLANKEQYPELNAGQIKKLRQLTLVEIAADNKILDYGLLLRTLDINDERELDELIIDSIYSGIIEGKINQKERLFKVYKVKARDAKENEVKEFIALLQKLQNDTGLLNSNITTEIQKLNEAKGKYLDNRRKLDEERTKALDKAKQNM